MAGSERDDRAWVRGAQRGSAADLEALFRHHWPRAYRAAYLVVHDAAAAEDIAQEAFLAAVRNLDRFDRRRPFGPWLHRIVVNRAIDWSRRRALRGEVELHDSPVEQGERDVGSDAVAALAGVLASPPGRSVIQSIREAVGVKKTQHELFSLPAPGRLLVNSSRGAWVVEQNGSKRLLGPYREASWSPFGRFVVALKD